MPPRLIQGLPSLLALSLVLVAGCSTQPGAPLVATVPSAVMSAATPTPLATENAASASVKPNATPKATPKPTPKPTAKPTPKPTSKPASYYKPPGWDGYSDVNCPDFDTHAHAQSFFKGTGGTTSNDPYGLDRDHDGSACETLP
jgi:hypothetical protein